ncbi:hypothetical protein TNCV_4459351 [Trichonephila clavipes]|nr:hypothetical protein TNCV_4459351 [Trichonephila clavipes]
MTLAAETSGLDGTQAFASFVSKGLKYPVRKTAIKIWNEMLLNWMGGEYTSGYCISKGKAIGNLRGISDLLGKVISLCSLPKISKWICMHCKEQVLWLQLFCSQGQLYPGSVDSCPSRSTGVQI